MRSWGMRGWVGIAVYVIAYDSWAGLTGSKTLSAEFRDQSSQNPVVMSAFTLYLVAHLFGKWPRRYDPLTQYTEVWGGVRNKRLTQKATRSSRG